MCGTRGCCDSEEFGRKLSFLIGFLLLVDSELAAIVPSPCPDVFEYRTGARNDLYGYIRVPRPNEDGKVELHVRFQVANVVQGGNGKIELLPENFQNDFLEYYLYFPFWQVYPPKILSISVNNVQVCVGPPFNRNAGRIITTINLWNTRTRVVTRTSCLNGNCDEKPPRINFRPMPPTNPEKVYAELGGLISNFDGFTITELLTPESNNVLPETVTLKSTSTRPEGPTFTPTTWDVSLSKLKNNPFLSNHFGKTQPSYPIVTPLPNIPNRNDIQGANSPPDLQTTYSAVTPQSTSSDDDGIYFIFPEINGGSNDNNVDFNKSNNNNERIRGTRPSINLDPIREDPEPTKSRITKPYPYSDICGTFSGINHLVYSGKIVTKTSEFPWLVAIFKKTLGLKFTCGGSLISKKHVVTAAHCMNEDGNTVSPQELVVLLGRKDLQSWTNDGALFKEPERLIIHPDFKKTTADADIALVVFREEIVFTTHVKPVCLWMEDNSLQDVVNRTGVVVGWGRDENGKVLSLQPKELTMPIVDQETCLWSNRAFRDVTSQRSFCAGYRNNSGPCNGDSGGGFVMKVDEKWVLRGVISLSLSKSDKTCDLNEYVVFTDASKFTDWFLSYMT